MSNRTGYYISDQYGLYYMTFTTVGWVDLFSRKECKDIIIHALQYCQQEKGLIISAYVLMESHLHIIARASDSSQGLSTIVRDFKKYTAKKILDFTLKSSSESRREWLELVFRYNAKFNTNNIKFQVWQQNNQPKLLLHPKFTIQKIDYIHTNPIRAGIVEKAEHYLHSSARNYLNRKDGLIEIDIIDFGVQEGYVM